MEMETSIEPPVSELSEHKSIVALATQSRRRHTEASLLVVKEGTYLLAYTSFFQSPRDDSDAQIVAITSHDHGLSWEDPVLAANKASGINVMAPSLLRLPDGSIGLMYLAKQSMQHGQMVWRRSLDDGQTWSEPRVVYDVGRYTICLNDVLVRLANGRILFPVCERLPGQKEWTEGEHMRAYCLFSDDMGATWQRSTGSLDAMGMGAMEPSVYEREPGHVILSVRTTLGKLWHSESFDQGANWSTLKETPFEAPNAPSLIKRRPGHDDVVMARNPKYYPDLPAGGPRIPLTLEMSRDRGVTWLESPVVLESDYSATFSYPSISFDREYLLLTYYYTKFRVALGDEPDLNFSLCFRRIPLAQLGMDTSA